MSAQEMIAQHKACDPATKTGPYKYTHARRATQLSVSCVYTRHSDRPPLPPPPGLPGCLPHRNVIATSSLHSGPCCHPARARQPFTAPEGCPLTTTIAIAVLLSQRRQVLCSARALHKAVSCAVRTQRAALLCAWRHCLQLGEVSHRECPQSQRMRCALNMIELDA